jgi:hypothetical protein
MKHNSSILRIEQKQTKRYSKLGVDYDCLYMNKYGLLQFQTAQVNKLLGSHTPISTLREQDIQPT